MKRPLVATALVAVTLAAAPAHAADTTLGIPDPIWKLFNLILFIAALGYFIGRPLGRFLESRRENIQFDLTEAERRLTEAEALRAEVVRRLEQVEAEAEEIRARAVREAEAEAERIAAEAEQEKERFLHRVEEEIVRRGEEARAQLAAEAADLTAELARELLSERITDADRSRVLKRNLDVLSDVPRRS